jgi:Ca2+-binding RTX toxin-like protein
VVQDFSGLLNWFELNIYGSAADTGDIFHFTDEYSEMAAFQAGRQTVSDTDGGEDWIDAAAVSTASRINLANGATSTVDGTSFTLVGEFEHAIGGDGADTLNGNGLGNHLLGMRDNDALNGKGGADTLEGGAGDDTLDGGEGSDTLAGGGGRDRLTGGSGSDRFIWTSAGESLPTLTGRDLITDWSAGDLIDLSGFDANTGLAGLQSFVFRGVTTTPANAAAGELWLNQFGGSTFLVGGVNADPARDFQVEIAGLHSLTVASLVGVAARLAGTEAANLLTGSALGDTLSGLGGADTITGGEGRDVLSGGTGADRFVWTSASESLPTLTGRDLITDWSAGDLIDLSGFDANLGLEGLQLFTFRGGTANTSSARAGELWTYQFGGQTFLIGGVDGDSTRDFQLELAGPHSLSQASFTGINLILAGTETADTLRGAAGADTLGGAGGNDSLSGGPGNDLLEGGAGKDTLSGGEGADRFVWRAVSESLPTGTGRDVITGWEVGDVLDLSAIDANSATATNDAFSFGGVVAASAGSNAAAGTVLIYTFGGNTYVVAGVNADPTRDFQIEILGSRDLTEANFVL